MSTYFASAQRTSGKELVKEIDIVTNHPVLSGLLHLVNGEIVIVDQNRQILAFNDSFFQMLGVKESATLLGLRPGEALNCVHADEEPGGCGTSKFCSSCGAAIAMVLSLKQDNPVERTCIISAKKANKTIDIVLLIRAHPMNINDNKFLLLFLQDITRQYQQTALERTFFHDVNNLLSILLGTSELLCEEEPSSLADTIYHTSKHLVNEISIQRCLSKSEFYDYQPFWVTIKTERIIEELQRLFINHPAAIKKTINISEDYPKIFIKTDISLLLRVLCNMVINALEATNDNGEIKIWFDLVDDSLIFYVWNQGQIPEKTALRIFQRNFSTKKQLGRGIGTFSMKLFGEQILGGDVDFTTSFENGTIFRFACPVDRNS
jgi:K+-sensing histidine kinase KdpD